MKKTSLHISAIKPYWRNPRINDQSIQVIKKSILKYGYISPIIVDKQHTIIAGHARYKALAQLGAKKCDVIIADLHPDLVNQYRIIDNKSSEVGQWDKKALRQELKDLSLTESFSNIFPSPKDIFSFPNQGNPETQNDRALPESDREETQRLLAESEIDPQEEIDRETIEKTRKQWSRVIDCPKCGKTFEFEPVE